MIDERDNLVQMLARFYQLINTQLIIFLINLFNFTFNFKKKFDSFYFKRG